MTKKECNFLLFSITLCWSSSYIFIKDLPADLSSYAYLTLTSGIAGLILAVVFHRSPRRLSRKTVFQGMLLAALLAGNMLLEKAGLARMPSSSASLLASLNIIIVPLILLLFRRLPSRNNVAGIFLILGGLLLSSGASFRGSSPAGILYMLGACALMSLYTVVSSEFTKETNPLTLSVLQIVFSALIGWVLWFCEDPATFAHVTWSRGMLSSIFILAFFSKAYAYIMLMYAEKYADALSVAVIASMEPVVTLVLALLIPNAAGVTETFSLNAFLGALVITLGAITAGLHFLSPHKNEPANAVPEPDVPKPVPEIQEPEKNSALRPFLLTLVPFAVLGAAFKVMVLVEGFTEVRPENAIPIVAGLLFGPVGGLGCAAGNLIADCFGSLNLTSLLGVAGNFLAAYLPYRIWYALSEERPNVHTWRNEFLYLWASVIGALSCAWILGFGLELFFSIWIESIYKYVFLNNLGFSLALGLPVFALICSNSICVPWRSPSGKPARFRLKRGWQTVILILTETTLLAAILFGVCHGFHLANSAGMRLLSAAAGIGMLGMLILPTGKETENAN